MHRVGAELVVGGGRTEGLLEVHFGRDEAWLRKGDAFATPGVRGGVQVGGEVADGDGGAGLAGLGADVEVGDEGVGHFGFLGVWTGGELAVLYGVSEMET